MDRERQGAYLRAMGIVPWRLAGQPQQAPADHEAFASEPARPRGVAEAVVDRDPPSAPASVPEQAEAPTLEPGDASVIARMDWAELRQAVSGCTRCALSQGRTQTVFGTGNQQARLMVIGEAPGAEEDRRGEPFVGPAGGLLDNMLLAMGLPRPQVFIANIVKCRPPGNRDPNSEEATACAAYLNRQIELVAPEVILAVGRVAAQSLLASNKTVGQMRGRVHQLTGPGDGQNVPLVVTYHPAYLLRSPDQKGQAWQDLKLAMNALGEAS